MAGKKPRVSVIERRLQNPFGEPSVEVQMKDQGVKPRWFNNAARNGQAYRAKQLGWEPVTTDMIADMESLGFHALGPDGGITRGERGQEVLLWMPLEHYTQIQAAKTKKNLEQMRDFDHEKQQALNAYAAKAGGTAAEFMADKIKPVGGVRTQFERVARAAEDGDE